VKATEGINGKTRVVFPLKPREWDREKARQIDQDYLDY